MRVICDGKDRMRVVGGNTKKYQEIIKPARSAGFSRIKKIPYQAPPTQLGPRKCTF